MVFGYRTVVKEYEKQKEIKQRSLRSMRAHRRLRNMPKMRIPQMDQPARERPLADMNKGDAFVLAFFHFFVVKGQNQTKLAVLNSF